LVVDAALTATTQFSFGHLRQFPVDGTVLQAEPSATFWTVNGNCRTAGQSGGATPVVATDFGVNAVPVCTLPPAVPGASTAVTAAVSGTRASVRWTAPSNNRSPHTHYTVTASPGAKTVNVSGTNATIAGLSAGTYTFRVRATNGVGVGPWSSASNAITIATVATSGGPSGGYWMLGADGTVYAFGNAPRLGSAGGPAVAIAARADGRGYWTVDAAGDVSPFGTAAGHGGNPAMHAGETVSTISATPSGNGYWLFTNRGQAFPYGDAHFYGDMSGTVLNGPVIASVATPTGHGYYMVGSDGGVFSFGDAHFHGSTGNMRLNRPIVGIAPTPNNHGYWLVASDGGVFAFRAPFHGSMGATHLNKPVNGLVAYGNGYLMVANDGGVFDFSNKAFAGSLANTPPPAPIIGIAAT
jgi:ribosomal protein L24E